MQLEEDIRAALNRASAESHSNTPDFILAKYLLNCLSAFNEAVTEREQWYGRNNSGPPVERCKHGVVIDPTGNYGQRYEVTVYDDSKDERIVIGWTDDAKTASDMGTAAESRPSWRWAQVRDRHAS